MFPAPWWCVHNPYCQYQQPRRKKYVCPTHCLWKTCSQTCITCVTIPSDVNGLNVNARLAFANQHERGNCKIPLPCMLGIYGYSHSWSSYLVRVTGIQAKGALSVKLHASEGSIYITLWRWRPTANQHVLSISACDARTLVLISLEYFISHSVIVLSNLGSRQSTSYTRVNPVAMWSQ